MKSITQYRFYPIEMIRLLFFTSLLVIFVTSCRPGDKHVSAKPNFIMILADDLGYNDIGCFGSDYILTPNLDRLAEEGMKLLDFHSNCSVCSPTRAALLTGRYQHRTGIVNVLGQTSAALPKIQGLPSETVTIAEMFREAGYQTAMFGKWHLGNLKNYHPLDNGFDYFFGVDGGMGNPFTYLPANAGPGTRSMLYRNREPVNGPGRYFTYRLADEVNDYLEKRDPEKPFFIYLPFTAPHVPLWKPSDSLTIWDGNNMGPHPGDLQSAYKETIEALDSAIGTIITHLMESGLSENTLVFFTSDNGPIDVGSCRPFKGRKTNLYEGGTRVPAIAWWPGTIKPGLETSELTTTMDIFPTFASLAGIPLSDTADLDGIDFSAVLLENAELPERMVFWEKPVGVWMENFNIRREAVRKDNWKLVRDRSGNELELYNLDTDTAEQFDLSGQYPEMVEALYRSFQEWKADVYGDSPMTLEEMIKYLEETGIVK